MYTANWKIIKEPFKSGEMTVCAYESETPYTAVMLISDLVEAGIEVTGVKYYSDEKDETNFCGGNLSAKGFTDRYDQIRVKGKFGMNYEIGCKADDKTFQAAMSDSAEGVSYNKIAFSAAAESETDFPALVSKLGKIIL